MTPQEKAYSITEMLYELNNDNRSYLFSISLEKHKVKQLVSVRNAKLSAFRCVDIIISECEKYGGFNVECEDDDGNSCSPIQRKEYWEEVKKEIGLLGIV